MTHVGRVRDWHDEEGWGVIDSAATPGGCWVHFSDVAVAGHRSLVADEEVRFAAEPADQDGYSFRALEVWPADADPVGPDPDQVGPSGAYTSSLTLSFDDQADVAAPDVRPAAPSQLDDAARVLARAFDAYPWTRWSLPAEDYSARLEEVQRLYLGYALEQGTVLVATVDEHVRAVAAFLPPDALPPADDVQQRVAELHGSRLAAVAALSPPQVLPGSWTLETLGVDPHHQGSGLGTALLSAGLARIDQLGAPVALVTSDEHNVRLYARLGFTSTSTIAIPDGPDVHAMQRPATPARRR